MIHVPLDKIVVIPGRNNRTVFDPDAMAELTESVRTRGVIEPIVLRLLPTQDSQFELVFGERRLRASKSAGKETIPAIVRQLSDADVLEVILIENLQREDISPLDEAHGYARLMKEHGYTVDQVAAKVGKQKRTVYARLQLTRLAPAVGNALQSGKLDASRGLLLARIPDPQQQRKAMNEILKGDYSGPYSTREAEGHIQRQYMTDLRQVPFPLADAALLPRAGACTVCAKNLRNQSAAVDSGRRTQNSRPLSRPADRCTDPACCKQKIEAFKTQILKKAIFEGDTIISPHESNESAKYVSLDACCYDDPKRRNYETLLRRWFVPVYVAVDDRGQVRRVVARTEAVKALKAAGYDFAAAVASDARSSSASDAASIRERKKTLEKQKLAVNIVRQIEDAARRGIPRAKEFWPMMARVALDLVSWGSESLVLKARGHRGVNPERGHVLKADLASMNEPEARGLFVALLAASPWSEYGGGFGKKLLAVCKHFGIDPMKVAAPKTQDSIAALLDAGKPITWPKDANALQATCADHVGMARILKGNEDTLKGTHPRKVQFGSVKFDNKKRPLWKTFSPLKQKRQP